MSERAVIPIAASAREVLEAINAWARGANPLEVRDVWAVLTALRGPDNGDDAVKWRTTARIRGTALPQLSLGAGAFTVESDATTHPAVLDPPEVGDTSSMSNLTDPDVSAAGNHFRQHIRLAAEYLVQLELESAHDASL